MTEITKIQNEIKEQLKNKETLKALVDVTFKGLDQAIIPRAIMEGMMRGFTFKDFLEKNVYALPFENRRTGKQEYSLVTSIDYARKLGMRSGVCGKSAPVFEEKDGKIISCTITIERKLGDVIGKYSATVYFDEYTTGRNLWVSKPRTMIAKVAEMHALRMACPEEAAQLYVEEEMTKETMPEEKAPVPALDDHRTKLSSVKNLEELKVIWSSIPGEAKTALLPLKEELKTKYANA